MSSEQDKKLEEVSHLHHKKNGKFITFVFFMFDLQIMKQEKSREVSGIQIVPACKIAIFNLNFHGNL